MIITTIKFNDIDYEVSAGYIFQAKIDDPIIHQIYVVQCNDNEQVYLEVLEKINSRVGLVRVNEIRQIKDNGEIYIEDYKHSLPESKPIKTLDVMTKKELITFATNNCISINTKSTKKKILEDIKNEFK